MTHNAVVQYTSALLVLVFFVGYARQVIETAAAFKTTGELDSRRLIFGCAFFWACVVSAFVWGCAS